MTVPASMLITGATSAIGGALALAYAAPGRTLRLHGRDATKLADIARRCIACGATVQTSQLDLADRDALADWLNQLKHEPVPDLVILNAGINAHAKPGAATESLDEIDALLEVNVRANMAIVDTVLPAMRERGRGQIALISSLAAWFGLPVMPAYCASKAALKAYGEALRGRHGPHGIRVSVVLPGFVSSAMCDRMPGAKPFKCSPERAARKICAGLAADKARISFPFPLNLGTWCLALLPASVSTRIVRWCGYDD